MCGIVGFLSLKNNERVKSEHYAAAMAARIAHRGPDSHGVWSDESDGIFLAHRRLAILDLSPNGHQPMASQSGRYVISFNGEIYNFLDLKRELAPKGYNFKGGSDTEIMLAAFEEWGIEQSLKRFNGMFAFALWDRKEKNLTIARDRMGQKPLFAGFNGDNFFFTSELKALKAHPEFKPEINADIIHAYLQYGYIPAPYSIYRGIYKLKQGEYAVISRNNDSDWIHKTGKYWDLPQAYADAQKHPISDEAEAINSVKKSLLSAVKQQMISDVPLGVFLSGGIDSSLITAIMQSVSSSPVKTFTIGFKEQAFDEAPAASRIARHLKTDHYEAYASEKDVLDTIPHIAGLCDEPFADSSIIPTTLVSRLARKHVTVALSGDGGDEFFMGYRRHFIPNVLYRRIPSLTRLPVGLALHMIPAPMLSLFKYLEYGEIKKGDITPSHIRAISAILRNKNVTCFYKHIIDFSGGRIKDTSDFLKYLNKPSKILPTVADRIAMIDCMHYMPDDIHMKVDRAGMSVALELRSPFMDKDVAETALSLPASMKLRGGKGKWILRKILSDYVPTELFERPKAGFAIPLDMWLKGELKEWAQSRISDFSQNNPTDINAGKMWSDYQSGRETSPHLIWAFCMLQEWMDSVKRN